MATAKAKLITTSESLQCKTVIVMKTFRINMKSLRVCAVRIAVWLNGAQNSIRAFVRCGFTCFKVFHRLCLSCYLVRWVVFPNILWYQIDVAMSNMNDSSWVCWRIIICMKKHPHLNGIFDQTRKALCEATNSSIHWSQNSMRGFVSIFSFTCSIKSLAVLTELCAELFGENAFPLTCCAERRFYNGTNNSCNGVYCLKC